ncbi:hypothetical protein [Paenibacillus sp. HJGM_3]|uniref:hypothetical protein n=1 Tax=Paenibacillus sp. HJGM_3 TaxID=3379816 RepID=UPI00385C4A45
MTTLMLTEMESLRNAIAYLGEGMEYMPLFFIEDPKSIKYKWREEGCLNMFCIESEVDTLLSVMEQKRAAVFFYPNGQRKDKWVKGIQWHFVDIDKRSKEEQWKLIKDAPLQPTIVYRGRAGHKLLYRVTEAFWDTSSPEAIQKSIAHFKNVQQQLIEYFNGDPAVINPSNALRLPFVKNYKDWPQVATEEVVSFTPDHIYSQQQLINAFPPSQKVHHFQKAKFSLEEHPEHLGAVLKAFTDQLDMDGLEWKDYDDRFAFQCPIHDDSSPSAYMFKSDLVIHCSAGAAGNCDIENGKHLKWVAESELWDDIQQSLLELESIREQKYLDIDLTSMSIQMVVPLMYSYGDHSDAVQSVLERVMGLYKDRGIEISPALAKVFANMTYHILRPTNTLCVPVPPGGGKSTWNVAFNQYNLQHDLANAGAVIVVERIESAKQLAKQLGSYEVMLDIDAPYSEERQAAYVMESAFTSEHCQQELTEYTYGICRGCGYRFDCPTYNKYSEQRRHPIVIITHSRLVMEKQSLNKYNDWQDANEKLHRRRFLIVDEKPCTVTVFALSLADIIVLEKQVEIMAEEIPDFTKTKQILGQVKDMFCQTAVQEIVGAIDPEFAFCFKSLWYKRYHGNRVGLLEQVELLIRQGGIWQKHPSKKGQIHVAQMNQFDFTDYNTLILDGTSALDMEYNTMLQTDFLQIPEGMRMYDNVSFHVAEVPFSKYVLRNQSAFIATLADQIKQIATNDKTLVLCHKEFEERLMVHLEVEISTGAVLLNHFGNVKGSNEYMMCTALVAAGTLHKGDPYYIAKHAEINGQLPEQRETTTIKGVRRFQDLELERLRLNDQLVSLIQDICRIAIRNPEFREPVKIYLPTKDKVIVNLLLEYFNGSILNSWAGLEMLFDLPDWYEPLAEVFSQLEVGQEISKKDIRQKLGWAGESSERNFRRIQNHPLYLKLLAAHGMRELNIRKLIKQTETAD